MNDNKTEAEALRLAELRRLHAYCQELESQVIRDCMTHVQNPAENEHIADDMSKNGAEMIMSTQPVAQQGAAYAALPEPLEIDWPELHSQALGCGVEDRGLHNRYECAEYGWQDGVDKCAERVPEQIFDADQMRAFADATHTLRASHAQAPAQADEYPALVCDYCGALTPDPWHSSGMLHGKMSKHIHSCDGCRGAAQAQAGAVPLTCEWTHNDDDGFWETACGEAWRFDDGGPAENSMKFCHSCGNSLRIKGGQHGTE